MAKNHAAGSGRSGFVRHGRLRRSNGWANALRIFLTAAVVVVLSGVATVAYAVWGLVQDVHTVDLGNEADTVAAGDQAVDGPLTILLVGSDTRAGQSYQDGEEGELNDVNLLLHVSADHQNATVVSFPRDLMIPFPSCQGEDGTEYPPMSEQQLNSAMMYGGLPCVASTISELTGMEIPNAGLVTFDGVIAISNAIGGVEVCLAQPISDPHTELELPQGEVTLQGNDALQFLRTRYGVGDGSDTSRISNQQVFMSSLVRKLRSAETLSDPVKVYSLAKAGVDNMTLSSNMASVQFMQQVAGTVKDIDLERINFVQYPTFTHPYQEGRLTPDRASADALFQLIESGQPFEVSGPGDGAVDGTGAEDPAAGGDPAAPAEVDPETGLPIDPATGYPIDPATGWPIDPATGWPIDPATGAPTDPATIPPAETPPPADGGAVRAPDNVKGQSASQQTCSNGRTAF